MVDKAILVLTTYPDAVQAKTLAGQLVSKKLAACVNILPAMTSVYEWKGKLENGTEHLLLIKTRQTVYNALEKMIREQHPYELPEVLVVPIESGLPEYLKWVVNNASSI